MPSATAKLNPFENTPVFERYPSSGLDILVVGGGIAGLSFAIEACRKGHQVRIIDRRPHFEDYGDMIAIQESVVQTLKAWPDFLDRCREGPVPTTGMVYKHTGEAVNEITSFAISTTRAILHNLLHQYVLHLGISVRHSARAVEYFEDADHAGVILEGEGDHNEKIEREKLVGDVVVAADGIGSRSWNLVLGKKEQPISSGFAMVRSTYPLERALANPVMAASWCHGNEARMLYGPGAHMVTARAGDRMIFMLTHKDNETSVEDWAKPTDPKVALPYVQGWVPWVHEMIKAAPDEGTVDYKLMWRNPREKWCSPGGRVIQIGDAAHTFLPTSASGATMAMEDGYSLATCLQLGGKSNVPLAVRVHNKLRFERVTCAQKMGFKTREKLHHADLDPNPNTSPDSSSVLTGALVGDWVLRHDPEQYAYEMYGRCANHLLTGAPFENSNYPPGHTFKLWTVQEMLAVADRHESIQDDGDWK